jgi:outer membrane protein TolC
VLRDAEEDFRDARTEFKAAREEMRAARKALEKAMSKFGGVAETLREGTVQNSMNIDISDLIKDFKE